MALSSASARASEGTPELEQETAQLQHYKPIYFLMGTPDTKVQFSFKLRVIENFGLYFAYSQLMMWDLFTKSSWPIRDVNYNPEVFYRYGLDGAAEPDQSRTWLDLGIFEHESNGKDGADTRSWNRSYVRYRSDLELNERNRLSWEIKAWVAYLLDEANADIRQYRGSYEFSLAIPNLLGEAVSPNDLIFRIYPGGSTTLNPIAGGQELTLRFRPPPVSYLRLLIVQVFHGYGENLLEYNQNRWGIRAGIGF